MYNFIKIFFLFIKNNKKKFKYLLISICIYLVIENIESFSDLINSYQKINYDYLIWYLLSISISSILVCYYVFLNFKNFNIKINFLKWSSMYFNSQIVAQIPSAGLVYRAIFLKKLKLDYLKFATIYIFIIWISLLVTLSIHFIYVCIFLNELKMFNINIYFYFFSLNLFLFSGYYVGSYFSKTKTFKNFFSSNNISVFLKKIIDTMVITFDHVITNKKYIKLIIILILIYASDMTTMFFCLKFLGFNISFNLSST